MCGWGKGMGDHRIFWRFLYYCTPLSKKWMHYTSVTLSEQKVSSAFGSVVSWVRHTFGES